MTAVWDDLAEPLGEQVAAELREMARLFELGRPRTQQRAIGPSEVGKPCARCLARSVLGRPVVRAFDDPWCRIIGTATHAWLDEAAVDACKRANRGIYVSENRVHPDPELLTKGGNADLYMVDRRMVVDHKIVSAERLKHYRHNGPGAQYRYQGHLYGLGYANAGWPVDHVAVAFWNRGGRLKDLYVWTEAYDPAIAHEALERFRSIRDLALAAGVAILPHLPADPDCWDCSGLPVDPSELTA
jgi:hypothetical protein